MSAMVGQPGKPRSAPERLAQAGVRWGLGHYLPSLVVGATARRGDVHAQAIRHSSRSQEMPIELFDRMRDSGSFYRGRLSYVTARLEVCREVLASNDVRAGVEISGTGTLARAAEWASRTETLSPIMPPSMLAIEPPDHTRLRKLVSRVFTARAVQRLSERAEQITDEILDGLPTDEPIDLVERFCSVLPVTVVSEILGVPPEDQQRVLEFGEGAAPSLEIGLSWREFRSVETSLDGFDAWLTQHLERVRRDPGDDLLSQLTQVRDDDGTELTQRELVATAGLVLAAGFETTVNLIGNGVALLSHHPAQRDALLAGDASWANATEEVLRYDPPVLLTGRTVVRDTVIAETPIPRHTLVTTLLSAANRDPAVFDDPHTFDVHRENARDHLAFSAGRHFCLGAALARMEGQVALRKLHERFEVEQLPGATRRQTRILRGYRTLPVRLTPAGSIRN